MVSGVYLYALYKQYTHGCKPDDLAAAAALCDSAMARVVRHLQLLRGRGCSTCVPPQARRTLLSMRCCMSVGISTSAARLAKPRVAVAMSGGVDSSVTAALLLRRGFDVFGVFMDNWDGGDERGSGVVCTADADYESAVAVARHLGIEVMRISFAREYWTRVFEPFLEQITSGRTPNPDVMCNRHVKFGALRDYVLGGTPERPLPLAGAQLLATGHYAQLWPPIVGADAPLPLAHVDDTVPPPSLHAAVDREKDQSDFLAGVSPGAWRRIMLPLGNYRKSEVRQVAASLRLPSATRKDSFGICFVGKRNMPSFLSNYMTLTPGVFVDISRGVIVGHTSSIETLTVGQRTRVGGAPHKYYAVKASRSGSGSGSTGACVYVLPGGYQSGLYCDSACVRASDMLWSSCSHTPTITTTDSSHMMMTSSDAQVPVTSVLHHGAACVTSACSSDLHLPFTACVRVRCRVRHDPCDMLPAVMGTCTRRQYEYWCRQRLAATTSATAVTSIVNSEAQAGAQPLVVNNSDMSSTTTLADADATQQQQQLQQHSRRVAYANTWRIDSPPWQPHVPVVVEASAFLAQDSTDSDVACGVGSDELVCVIVFDSPVWGIAPGQVLVVYSTDEPPRELLEQQQHRDTMFTEMAHTDIASSSSTHTLSERDSDADRRVIACGPLLASGPTRWDLQQVTTATVAT